jgi:glycogen phosphorylase
MLPFRTELTTQFSLPRRIARLGTLAYNLWWTWNPDAQRLFLRIDADVWERCEHNPIRFLRQVGRARLNAVIQDRYYLDSYDRILRNFDEYMAARDTWFSRTYPPENNNHLIAYFSTEFGLHETLPIYSGGLGVLSGDLLKSASDLGLPIVGIGLFYDQAYFSQHITEDGWQEANNVTLKFDELPIQPWLDKTGKPCTVTVELPGRSVLAKIWEVRIGRIPLYLLDTLVDGNSPADRELTARLYISDLELRISQEIILGIGGVRALRLLGYHPAIWHMNEGHSAFLTFERARELVATGQTFEKAVQEIRATTVFTTHTPVPAGNQEFPLWMIDKYFSHLWPQLGLERDKFLDLARHQQDWGETFNMTILALRLSDHRNAVSELHNRVARKMYHYVFPDLREEDVPISYITNGIHHATWLARRLRHLYTRYLGEDWMEHSDDPDVWKRIEDIPDDELWAVRMHLKRKLVAYMRETARTQWLALHVHPVQVVAGGVLLNPYALTIGFARRFATYKRANLILRDFNRLLSIVNRPNLPVQIIFAGKAHPTDEPAKLLIQGLYRAVKKAESGGRLVFMEDYDINLARYLIQGVDVWLNTPRRPNEACGTSGQKAAINGVLNFSVLDGWWREGYNGSNGWAIGDDTDYADPNYQDEMDAQSLYDKLENEIIPLYYNSRSADGLPSEWIERMKESIRTLGPQFNMHRMVKEYTERMYFSDIKVAEPEVEE